MDATFSRWDWLWLIACGLLSSLWCLSTARELSATYDEPVYIKEGLEHWRTGSYRKLMRLGTMPLPVDVQTLPLYLWEQWRGTPFDIQADFGVLLPVARATTLGFWWLLLLYGMKAARVLAGPWAGRVAVAMMAFEPSLIAHAALATTDIALTACLLAFAYHFRQGREAGSGRRLVVPAIWLALAILAKASGLIFGGLCMLALELERLARNGAFSTLPSAWLARARHCWQTLGPLRRDAGWIVGGGLAGVLLYCGSDWQPEPSFIRWARTLPEGPFASTMLWLADHLRIFTNGGEGLVQQFKHNVRGHGTFILGQGFDRAVWYYFPVLLTIKLTLPLLLAPVVLGLVRPRALLNGALVTAGLLLLLSPAFRVQIGLRLVLPLVVLAMVGLAAALVSAWQELEPGWRRGLVISALALAVCWPAGALWASGPHALCFVNLLYGGSNQGYQVVSDANYDWGQGLPELVGWQQENGEQPCVWHFSADPRAKYWVRELGVHCLNIENEEDARRQLDNKLLAVSTTLLCPTGPKHSTEAHRQAVHFLRTQSPVARTTTFLIYDFRR